ncbi:iron complex outermembrane recepter protein [Desulfocicer vacuolatum DSM 3385]|uniref:Iron complex outermembrane recepter protein n=1 Tax=Desulfocicer vacuolatum DSM 3385 TaxID=1121400 RepID=A0A1W2DFA2_9BACT|nr:TonB-dependent receptor [Desulfocicer vacuolatum]SMC95696.1 iron complex outermembrane recepter protein [Desulfocicer vacuolatum DSM 3385]
MNNKTTRRLLSLMVVIFSLLNAPARADEKETVYDAGEIQVTARDSTETLLYLPEKNIIDVTTYESTSMVQNISDIVRDQVIVDFQGGSDLVPDDDTLFLRGFSSKRFVTALDGTTLRKTGGRKSSHIVDYALLPPFLMESIEILPGPHSCLYPGKSIGGVLNLVTKAPQRHESLKPTINLSTGFSSYGTQNHSLSVEGGYDSFTYDVGIQKYATDGYLRNNAADIDTVFSRLGYITPSNGYVTLSASYTDADREIPINNNPDDPDTDYDNDYPVVSTSPFNHWADPTWDKIATSYRMDANLPSQFGNWKASAFYSEENRNRQYYDWINSKDHSLGITDASWDTKWKQQGGKIQNEFALAKGHTTTLGMELEQCFDGYGTTALWSAAHDYEKRIDILSGFAQHQWQVIPSLTVTAGMRYETVDIRVGNYSSSSGAIFITDQPKWIDRSFDGWLPKSWINYELDRWAECLRDSSISLGVSRIWRAPDYHGDYNPQGRPAGAWLDPEHGIGCDLVFSRRVFNDITMKLNYAWYNIKDYIATNKTYSEYTPSKTNKVTPGLEYKDYKINLDRVVRHGIELQFSGHLTDTLSFMAGYAWQRFENKGGEPAGETELDNRAKNRINAGFTWNFLENTSLIVDYEFQDEQVIEQADEVAPDEWAFDSIAVDAYHRVDLAVSQVLFKKWGSMSDGTLKVYAGNVFNETYEDADGYPATDRTFGIGFSVNM